MTEKELSLIQLIRENDNPEQALTTAVNTILLFLEQHESSQVPCLASLLVQA